MIGPDRRGLIAGLAATAGFGVRASAAQMTQESTLEPWRPGTLEIHHIATGRGDCTLVIGPERQGLMIDAGATADGTEMATPARPNGSMRPGQWIARYARRRLGREALDYFLASHLHPDHVGDPAANNAPASRKGYRLSGLPDVADRLPIWTVLDRGWPDYGYVEPIKAPFADNYLAFMRDRAEGGGRNLRIEAGRADQINFGTALVRVVACNGRVWTGRGDQARETFPPFAGLRPEDRPNENMCSAALRISFAGFSYFTGGDLTANTFEGALPWADIEGAAARACGPVDVAAACHHGYYDAVGADTVRALKPRVWVVPAWHVTHPDMKPLERIFSERLYAGPRDLFVTQITPEARKTGDRFLKLAKSLDGHVVVRVEPDGNYRIIVTDSADETDRVKAVFGPFQPRSA